MAETIINVKVKKLPEGLYLVTSDELPGLVAQGRTVAEAMEIARDVARKLVESCIEHGDELPAKFRTEPEQEFCAPLAVGLA